MARSRSMLHSTPKAARSWVRPLPTIPPRSLWLSWARLLRCNPRVARSTSSPTTSRRIRPGGSHSSWPIIPSCTCISLRPIPRGSIRSNSGSAASNGGRSRGLHLGQRPGAQAHALHPSSQPTRRADQMDLPRLLAQNHPYFRFSCYRPLAAVGDMTQMTDEEIERHLTKIKDVKQAFAIMQQRQESMYEWIPVMLVTFTEAYLQDVLAYVATMDNSLMSESQQSAKYAEVLQADSVETLAN